MSWQHISDISLAVYMLYHANDRSMDEAQRHAAYEYFQKQVHTLWQRWQEAAPKRSYKLDFVPFEQAYRVSSMDSLSLHNEQTLGDVVGVDAGQRLAKQSATGQKHITLYDWGEGIGGWGYALRHGDTFVYKLVLHDTSVQSVQARAETLQQLSEAMYTQLKPHASSYARPWVRVWLPEYTHPLSKRESQAIANQLTQLGKQDGTSLVSTLQATGTSPFYCLLAPASYVLFLPDEVTDPIIHADVVAWVGNNSLQAMALHALVVAHSKIVQRHYIHYEIERLEVLPLLQQEMREQSRATTEDIRRARGWRILARQQQEAQRLERAQDRLHRVLGIVQELDTLEHTVRVNLEVMEESLEQLEVSATIPKGLQHVARDIQQSQQSLQRCVEALSQEINSLSKVSSLRSARVQRGLGWLAMVFLLEKAVKFTTSNYQSFAVGQPLWAWLHALAPFAQIGLIVVTGLVLGYWLVLLFINFPKYMACFALLTYLGMRLILRWWG